MDRRALDLAPRLVALRRDIHRHPEVGFQERRTAALIARTLRPLGLKVRTGVGITGVVGDLGRGGPTIAIRADMDALPIQELNRVPYRSLRPGFMHACGHDAHVACALGAAMLLAKDPPPRGRVRFLFQPSEEQKDAKGKSGAMRMIDDGALDGVDAAIALHTKDLPLGAVGVRSGPLLVARDTFRITLTGKAAHGAYPAEGVDAIYIAAHVIQAIQGIVSRRLPGGSPAVITVGRIEGGVRENVVADRVVLLGTAREGSAEIQRRIREELRRVARVAETLGGRARVEVVDSYPATINAPAMADLVRAVGRDLLGAAAVREAPLDLWSEDFSYMARRVPSAMFWLGVRGRQGKREWHNPLFDIDERALPIGAAMLAGCARRYLA